MRYSRFRVLFPEMKSIKNIAFLPILLLCFFFDVGSVSALTISPVKVEVTGDPGQTLRGEIEVLNEQIETKTYFSSFENFEPSGDTGSPKFIGSKDGLATWLQTQPTVSVANGETVKIPYTITIPANAEPGGYFAAIFLGEQDPGTQSAGEVSIGGKIGVLILLRVSGDIEEQAGISEFSISDSGKFQTTLPITFAYRFANSGGDRVVPLGDILVKNTFGGITATLPANTNEGSVLPNSARKFQVMWNDVSGATSTLDNFFSIAKSQFNDFHFGIYKAELSVVYGATNQTATDSFRFLFIPWQLLTIAFVGLVMVLFALRRYNAWIISKSKLKT